MIGNGEIRISWNPPSALNGEVLSYKVTLENSNTSAEIASMAVPGNETNTVFKNLPAGLSLAASVVTTVKPAMNNVGGFYSEPVLLGLIAIPDYGE